MSNWQLSFAIRPSFEVIPGFVRHPKGNYLGDGWAAYWAWFVLGWHGPLNRGVITPVTAVTTGFETHRETP
jgi:hypothetical protein